MRPLTNRCTQLVVLAFESLSGWAHPTLQKLVNLWEQQQRDSRRVGADRGLVAGRFQNQTLNN